MVQANGIACLSEPGGYTVLVPCSRLNISLSSNLIGFIDHENNGWNIPETRLLQGYLPQSVT
jgi:hypothetical protein